MTTLPANISSIYGEKGNLWLEELPNLVTALALSLGLRDLQEITNLSYNYLLSGFQGPNPIILKLSLAHEALKREALALKCFTGCGTIKVLTEDVGMLLLERALPGTSLKSYFPDKEQEAIAIACMVRQKLTSVSIPEQHNFPHIQDWLSTLDKDWDLPPAYLQEARKLRDRLLQASGPDVLLHGDLHHDNILQHGETWVVIDPQGVIGEPAYEIAAFIRNPMPDLLRMHNALEIIQNRIMGFAKLLKLPPQRILDWCFVQAVLAWVWALEDGCDPSYFEQLTKIFAKLALR